MKIDSPKLFNLVIEKCKLHLVKGGSNNNPIAGDPVTVRSSH